MDFLEYKIDFQDPYAAEGAERARRFAHNFNAQQLFGPSGLLEQCGIVREAHRSLLPEHLKIFCAKIGHRQSSDTFKTLLELGGRCDRWEAAFNTSGSSIALLQLIALSPQVFETVVAYGEDMMCMDANELCECIVDAQADNDE